ncbi:MAG: 4Fe-4S dicluster domain-containing protein [Lachnospiraceae bacterium]|nr:4Fe-4S dicluster domain-containing protein [Lachnospiraceae bacterium]
MEKFFHAVTLDKDKCLGCTNCIKRCPTSAIRVRDGKARILKERCVDCGECIRVCPHHAKVALSDPLYIIETYDYSIALPAPSLFAQFNNLEDPATVVEGLLRMGFDEVFEVAQAAELVSDATRRLIDSGAVKTPVISSACPTISQLIRIRFPNLIDHLLPLLTPAELAGKMAREQAAKRTGIAPEKIGTVFITPCPAKAASIVSPLTAEKSHLSAAVAIKDVYPVLVGKMKEVGEPRDLSRAGRIGLSWGSSGGEASAILVEDYLAADGIENCIKVLSDMEDEKLNHVSFVELDACPGGCVGGVLTVENPYLAMVRLKSLRRYLPVSRNRIAGTEVPETFRWETGIQYEPVMRLDPDLTVALEKMDRIDALTKRFPGLDCGSCGSPSCRALAEDIVRGYSTEEACVFVLRDEVQEIAASLSRLSASGVLAKGKENPEPPKQS